MTTSSPQWDMAAIFWEVVSANENVQRWDTDLVPAVL